MQNQVVDDDSVLPLQKFCKMKYGNFGLIRLFVRSLGAIETKRIELDQEFRLVLEIQNKPTRQKTQQ